MALEAEIESALGWWRDAGADVVVGDHPVSWLNQPARRKARAHPAAEAAPADTPLPPTLAELRAWLLETETLPMPREARLAAEGDPAAGLMVLVDMPETGDTRAGALVSGETGALLDRMLAAIGRDRAAIYLAALSPAHLPGERLEGGLFETLAAAARHHVALAAPQWLLLMGDAPSRAFCGSSLAQARGTQQFFNHDGGTVSVTATFHPRFLLQQPRLKADSWKDLQMLIEGMSA